MVAMTKTDELFNALAGIIAPVVNKKSACDGWKTSDCCGAAVDPDILICGDCKEHCSVQCDDCPEQDCDMKPKGGSK